MRLAKAMYVLAGVAACSILTGAQSSLDPSTMLKVDAAVSGVMTRTHVPSASVGIVRNGRIVLTKAYGQAKLQPSAAATTGMHYAIGSISKQFTAACLLLLQEEGKLSIDDPIAKYFPELTRAKDVTIRNILSHTSGYQDYAPQDYTIPEWTKPTTAEKIVHEWATKPLDFEPGTQYQYSNTNFNIAGLIVEKVTGEKFWPFLTRRVLRPLKLDDTIDLDTQHDKLEPTGYMQNALGPLRPAIMEAPGWYFADGEIAMPVRDLLTWDISLIDRTLLKPASYAEMETDTKLKGSAAAGTAHYGLGLTIGTRDGHRVVSHGGEVGGFVAQNMVLPDDKLAVAVLTNQEASSAAGAMARAIVGVLMPVSAAPVASMKANQPTSVSTPMNPRGAEDMKAASQAKQILTGLQKGDIDRSLLTPDCNFYFDAAAIADYASSLQPLGAVQTVTQSSTSLRGGMTFRSFDVAFSTGTKARLTTYTTSGGKLEQFIVAAAG